MVPLEPENYKDWHDLPADRRDRAIVLRIARARGIVPRWAARFLSNRDRIERLERLYMALQGAA